MCHLDRPGNLRVMCLQKLQYPSPNATYFGSHTINIWKDHNRGPLLYAPKSEMHNCENQQVRKEVLRSLSKTALLNIRNSTKPTNYERSNISGISRPSEFLFIGEQPTAPWTAAPSCFVQLRAPWRLQQNMELPKGLWF